MLNFSVFGFVLVMLGVLAIGAGPYLVWWIVKTLREGAIIENQPLGPPDDSATEVKRLKAKEQAQRGG